MNVSWVSPNCSCTPAPSARASMRQDRETTPHRLGWVVEALEIEINNLVASATPATDQPSALGHDPQQITAGRITELPVGIGSVTLNQSHEMASWAGSTVNLLPRFRGREVPNREQWLIKKLGPSDLNHAAAHSLQHRLQPVVHLPQGCRWRHWPERAGDPCSWDDPGWEAKQAKKILGGGRLEFERQRFSRRRRGS